MTHIHTSIDIARAATALTMSWTMAHRQRRLPTVTLEHAAQRAELLMPLEPMTTKLEGPLKRELEIAGAPYTITIAPAGMTLVLKGRRKGFELTWDALVSGDAAIAAALNASLTANLDPKTSQPNTREPVTSKASTKRRAGNGKSKRPGRR